MANPIVVVDDIDNPVAGISTEISAGTARPWYDEPTAIFT